ncbi:hypothetical protein EDD22DRAFT_978793 [Suillus occidentalis]|nr:hypothetical protein EDD22DRAFT_978793 [Suillus occidentalis]
MACAKYRLAAVNWLLDSCGSLQGFGHNIGCTSRKTIAGSSIGAKAEELNLIVAVNAFHGYVHNRRCQLANHPLYLDGFGIEDLETCEHIFSSSNNKYMELSHASLINEYTPLLHVFKTHTSFSDEDFVRWKAEESEFLTNLALEPPSDAFAVAYVEELEKLRSVEFVRTLFQN